MLILLGALVAHAGSTVNVSSMEVNGLEIRDLNCELSSGGFFASMAAVSALAEQKAEFDKCQPQGGAFAAGWTWAGGKTSAVSISKSSASKADSCVVKALEKVQATLVGTCTGTVLAGDKVKAGAAADALK